MIYIRIGLSDYLPKFIELNSSAPLYTVCIAWEVFEFADFTGLREIYEGMYGCLVPHILFNQNFSGNVDMVFGSYPYDICLIVIKMLYINDDRLMAS